MSNDRMTLGRQGLQRFQEIYAEGQDRPERLTPFDIDFLTDYYEKVEIYAEGTFISEKQIDVLRRIAKKLDLTNEN